VEKSPFPASGTNPQKGETSYFLNQYNMQSRKGIGLWSYPHWTKVQYVLDEGNCDSICEILRLTGWIARKACRIALRWNSSGNIHWQGVENHPVTQAVQKCLDARRANPEE
jgi:hypothetical protein